MNKKLIKQLSTVPHLFDMVTDSVVNKRLADGIYNRLKWHFGLQFAEEINYHFRLLQIQERLENK